MPPKVDLKISAEKLPRGAVRCSLALTRACEGSTDGVPRSTGTRAHLFAGTPHDDQLYLFDKVELESFQSPLVLSFVVESSTDHITNSKMSQLPLTTSRKLVAYIMIDDLVGVDVSESLNLSHFSAQSSGRSQVLPYQHPIFSSDPGQRQAVDETRNYKPAQHRDYVTKHIRQPVVPSSRCVPDQSAAGKTSGLRTGAASQPCSYAEWQATPAISSAAARTPENAPAGRHAQRPVAEPGSAQHAAGRLPLTTKSEDHPSRDVSTPEVVAQHLCSPAFGQRPPQSLCQRPSMPSPFHRLPQQIFSGSADMTLSSVGNSPYIQNKPQPAPKSPTVNQQIPAQGVPFSYHQGDRSAQRAMQPHDASPGENPSCYAYYLSPAVLLRSLYFLHQISMHRGSLCQLQADDTYRLTHRRGQLHSLWVFGLRAQVCCPRGRANPPIRMSLSAPLII